MKTAVIGLGTIGGTIATLLIGGGVGVIVADRSLMKAEDFARKLGEHARALPVDKAIEAADVIVMAVWFDAISQLVQDYKTVLPGKIVVDPSNPIAPDGKGGFTKTIPATQSSGQIIAGLLPPSARLVKAFGSLSGATLASAANRAPEQGVLFYATDDSEAGGLVAELIEATGFEAIPIGGVDQSIRIEVFGDLHEFGKLGKMVSAREARALLDHKPDSAAD